MGTRHMIPAIPIVYEHPDFIIVNKPVELTMHDAQHGIIPRLCKQTSLPSLFLVHRLDDKTSGCIILAKNASAAREFGKQFEKHAVQKYYVAIISNKPKKKQGKICGDMLKSRNGSYKLSTLQTNPALTYFFTQSIQAQINVSSEIARPALRIVYLQPKSGKTHQLRVALKSLGSPILGDDRYKGSQSDRMYLHSYKLDFEYKGTSISVKCKPFEGEIFGLLNDEHYREFDKLAWPKA